MPHAAFAGDQPHLFFDTTDHASIDARSQALPWLQRARTEILAKADSYLQVPTAPYPLTGPQNDLGTAGRTLQNRLGTLGFASYLTGNPRYAEKGRDILLAVVRQTEPGNKAQWQTHLQQGDAAQAFAIGYDWLYDAMTEAERAEVRAEMEEVGALLYEANTTWGKDVPGVTSSNHNSVHFGALGLVGLALGDRPDWVDLATQRVRAFFRTFADPTGYATEGVHYVGYGLGGAVPFSMALKRKGGPDLLAEADETLAHVGDQMVWKLLPFDGLMLPLNDNFDRPAEIAALVGTLRHKRGDQLWATLESLEKSGSIDELGGYFGISYTAPFLFLWGDEPVAPVDPITAGLPLGHRFESGKVFLRDKWIGDDATHVSFKSGYDEHRGHDHQDENSVTFYAKGEGWLIDPQYWLERSDAHTTLKINGAEQIKGGDGRLVEYREDARGAFVRGQAEEAYDFDTAFVGQADRKLYFVRTPRPYILFRDDARTEDSGQKPFESRYVTYPGNRVEQAGEAVIIHGERNGAKALLAVFSGTEQLRVGEDDLSDVVLVRRGSTFRYDKYLRRLAVRFTDESPELISLVVPFEGDVPPAIAVTPGTQRYSFVVSVTFADAQCDAFLVEEDDISLQ
ncbi:heparinase II/III family protein [Altererythrobacter sp. GH1-8]|uniref:heparinase II/III domain-containing protein n=1 Tax=Altererythrobacter sp. GH1-8 TaxID=3349333 RepID=UPI00374D4FE2